MEMMLHMLGYGFIAVVLLVVGYLFVKILAGGMEALHKDND